MKRGDVVTVAMAGDYGKPRPAVVIQSDRLDGEASDSILICQITTHASPKDFLRLPVEPNADNGLREPSQIMAEKIFAVRRDKCGKRVGHLDHDTIARLDAALEFVLGLLD